MKREQVNKFVDKLVELTFKKSWFNEATQEWVDEEEKYIGILKHCKTLTQRQYYVLDSDKWLPTYNACWSANSIKTLKEVSK